ncbi:hypothetical protein PIB30_003084 [Stylosanthes scabra]|uniref:J domain-containing protein n=1 Tax=Stylosanthes scabra TaxID=79078 RepID=A0ABU6X303_9FABA|nr:hypothetical protein [Stylosanthes scabra]
MSNLITLYRPHTLFFSSFITCRHQFQTTASSFRNPNCNSRLPSPSLYSSWLIDSWGSTRTGLWFRVNHRRTLAKASNWDQQQSPYETLELDRDADEEQIKSAYRRLAKFYHPDVYDDEEKRRQYDMDNRVNPMKASEAWMEWLIKKRKAFDQRGDMAVAAWAEQQQRELNLRVRQLSRSKMDPDEARKILAREKAAAAKNFSNTLKRHTLVLKKRDLMRRKAEQDKDKLISQLLAAEGLESDSSDE